jgi:hypothetical protein
MLLLIPPSSNSIIEFKGEQFGGIWAGNLVYGWWSGGEIRRLILSTDGATVEDQQIVAEDFNLPIAMVQAQDGTIYVAEFGSGLISYLRPVS